MTSCDCLVFRKHARAHKISRYRRHIVTFRQHSYRLTILNFSAVLDQMLLILIQYFYVSFLQYIIIISDSCHVDN